MEVKRFVTVPIDSEKVEIVYEEPLNLNRVFSMKTRRSNRGRHHFTLLFERGFSYMDNLDILKKSKYIDVDKRLNPYSNMLIVDLRFDSEMFETTFDCIPIIKCCCGRTILDGSWFRSY